MTNVPGITFGPTGVVPPSEQDVLAGVQADTDAAFGGGVNPALNTPQGQLATTETAVIGQANAAFCWLANSMDPAFAAGRMQDAIGRIYFITRNPAQPTTVACTCTGAAAIIPDGAQAKDAAGNTYSCVTGGTLPPGGGSITLNFANLVSGPIPCPVGSLTIISQVIPGWDSITNPADGVLGSNTESRAEFEARRQQSVAKNSRGTIQAIQGAVLDVPGVLDAFSYQNDTSTPVNYRGATIGANSIYVAAVGGNDLDVATAIWSKKSPGCGYSGTTVIVVTDTDGYSPPYPTYNVAFVRPASVPIQFMVQIANSALVPSDAAVQVQNAIISAFAGGDGGPRARIGSTIYAPRYVTPVAALGSWAQVISLLVMQGITPVTSGIGSITGTTLTVGVAGSNLLSPGLLLVGANMNNALIVSQLSGTPGGIGTYQLNAAQTAASGSFTAWGTTQNSVALNINQAPVVSASNIFLVLT